MKEDLLISSGLIVPAAELTVELSRSGGPGGQHVNKTETRVRLRFHLDESAVLSADQKRRLRARYPAHMTSDGTLFVVCDKYRSQHRNLDEARERLAQMILNGLKVAKRRKKTKPTRASRERRLNAKKQRSQVKSDRKKIRHD
jgi:ribosome-associated protein